MLGVPSNIIVSNLSFNLSISSCILSPITSSEGLGGISPADITNKFSTSVLCIHFSMSEKLLEFSSIPER